MRNLKQIQKKITKKKITKKDIKVSVSDSSKLLAEFFNGVVIKFDE